jgi:hypothetical protein
MRISRATCDSPSVQPRRDGGVLCHQPKNNPPYRPNGYGAGTNPQTNFKARCSWASSMSSGPRISIGHALITASLAEKTQMLTANEIALVRASFCTGRLDSGRSRRSFL